MSAPAGPPGGVPEAEPLVAESATSTADLQNEAVRGSWWTAVQAVVGLPLGIAANLVVARSLGPHGYGVLASYMTAYVLILAVLNAGISDATIQWGAAAHARGDRAELLDVCRKCAGFHIFVEAPLAAIIAVVLLHRESVAVQAVGAVSVAATMLFGTTVVVLTAMSRNAPLAKINLVFGVAVQLAVVTAAVQSHAPGWTWVARLAVATLIPIASIGVAPRDIRRASFTPRWPTRWPAGFARYSVRTLFAGLVTSLVFSRCELLVLDAYGDARAAGLFALAAGLAAQITAPVDAMLGPLIPAAAGLVEVGRARAANAVLRGMRLTALATAPVVIVVVPLVAVLVPAVYGGRFTDTGVLFIGLGTVSCLQSVLHPVTAFVAALRKPVLVLGTNAAALVVDLVLVVVLAPRLGAAGAVWGNCAGQLVSLAASLVILRRHLGLSLRACARALGPFVALSAVVVAAATVGVLVRSHGAVTGGAAALGAAVVIGLLVARASGGLATEDDLDSVSDGFPRMLDRLRPLGRRLGVVGPPTRRMA